MAAARWQRPDGVDPQAWEDFEVHRKEIRKPLTDLARTKAANLLQALTPNEQRACVDKSIQSRWPGRLRVSLLTDRTRIPAKGLLGEIVLADWGLSSKNLPARRIHLEYPEKRLTSIT
jgi:hypothetical protein